MTARIGRVRFRDRGSFATAKTGILRYFVRYAANTVFARSTFRSVPGMEGRMRKVLGLVGAALLFAGPALAADLGTKPPPPPVYKAPPLMPVFSWTGWYLGGNIGYGWGTGTSPVETDNIGLPPALNSFPALSPKGVIGGGQIGYDWQFNPNLVLGLVADFQGADIQDAQANTLNSAGLLPFSVTEALSQKLDFLGTGRVRLGWAANNWLFYGSGGVAYGNVKSTISFSDTFGDSITGARSESRVGWAAGGGVNYALTQNWIIGVDYLHYDLGNSTVTGTDAFGDIVSANQKVGGDIVRGVINYKF
jgi:outer membrane immunogenic protein